MANDSQLQSWAEQGSDWVDNAPIFEAVLAPFAEAVMQVADIGAGARVLDIGCGFGTLLQRAAALGAEPFGVDISDVMVQAARRRVPAATVLLGDAQNVDLNAVGAGEPFDRIVSRFGVMFFDDPVAAFTNIRKSAAPGARLAFVCWREGENPIFTMGTRILIDRMEAPHAAPDPTAPGPLAFGNDNRVRAILTDAGWADIHVEAFDGVCDYSGDGSDGVEDRLTMILSSTTGQRARAELQAQLGAQGWAGVVEEVRAELRRHLIDGLCKFPGHTWVFTATNPG
ncbi:MAG: class I SAM-dependent methyltransferase [Mycobacterium sp.]